MAILSQCTGKRRRGRHLCRLHSTHGQIWLGAEAPSIQVVVLGSTPGPQAALERPVKIQATRLVWWSGRLAFGEATSKQQVRNVSRCPCRWKVKVNTFLVSTRLVINRTQHGGQSGCLNVVQWGVGQLSREAGRGVDGGFGTQPGTCVGCLQPTHGLVMSCCIYVATRGFWWASRLPGRKAWGRMRRGERGGPKRDSGSFTVTKLSKAGMHLVAVGPAGLRNAAEGICSGDPR